MCICCQSTDWAVEMTSRYFFGGGGPTHAPLPPLKDTNSTHIHHRRYYRSVSADLSKTSARPGRHDLKPYHGYAINLVCIGDHFYLSFRGGGSLPNIYLEVHVHRPEITYFSFSWGGGLFPTVKNAVRSITLPGSGSPPGYSEEGRPSIDSNFAVTATSL